MRASLLVLAVCLLQSALALVVDPPDGSQSQIFMHVPAQFSAQSFDVSAPIILASPPFLCSSTPEFAQAARGKMLLVLRGNCTFWEKALMGQSIGAAAVLVANRAVAAASSDLIVMGAPDYVTNTSEVTIPVVSVTSYAYETLYGFLTTSNHTVFATLNAEGQVEIPDDWASLGSSLRLLTIFVLVLPGLWLVGFMGYWLRRRCRDRANRVVRTRIAREIPLIEFHRPKPASSNSNNEEKKNTPVEEGTPLPTPGGPKKIHNDACAVCLDDFEEGSRIKVLPCGHGFHGPCIDPWLDDRSDLCPICKASILAHINNQPKSCCYALCGLCACCPRDGRPGNANFQRIDSVEAAAAPPNFV